MTYKDKHGNIIKAGMKIRHNNGDIEKVLQVGKELGLNASNPKFLELHPDYPREIYPLSQFDLREWEIIEDGN